MKIGLGEVLRQIRVLFIPYLFILVGCLIVLTVFTKPEIYFAINSRHFAFGDAFFALYTNMGDGVTCAVIALLLLIFNYRKGFLVGSSYIITSLLAQGLKRVFSTPRPVIYFQHELSRLYLIKGVEMLEVNSFPSGHTVSAFSAAVVLTYVTPKKYWGLVYLVLAMLVGYSRMYLSEHFFEDVTGGSVIGVFVTIFWLYWIEDKSFIHSAKWNTGLIHLRKQKQNA